MKFLAKIVSSALFGVAVAGSAAMAQAVTIDYDHTVNFAKFKTYTWNKVHASSPDVESRITLALNRSMTGRYMTEVAKDGDVTVTAVEAVKDQQEFSDFYSGLGDFDWKRTWGTNGFMDAQAGLADVPLGTLVIDMYDTKTHKLLWRGTVTEPAVTSGDKSDRTIDKAVTELIGKYPPKFKK